jgi:hypothetical protein
MMWLCPGCSNREFPYGETCEDPDCPEPKNINRIKGCVPSAWHEAEGPDGTGISEIAKEQQ